MSEPTSQEHPPTDVEALRARLGQGHGSRRDDRPRGQRWALSRRALLVATILLLTLAALIGARLLTGAPGQIVPLSAMEMPGENKPSFKDHDELAPAGPAPPGGAGKPAASEPQVPPAPGGEDKLLVHVVGNVREPGIVELTPGARVVDALNAAGGASAKANLTAVNLARTVADGEQIHIPAEGEPPGPTPRDAGPTPDTGPPGARGAAAGDEPIDINRADVTTLEALPGIGPVLAQRIVDHRSANGPFTAVAELRSVSGIGPAIMGQLEDRVRV